MDHNEAVRLQAAEKYVLGELSPSQREEYEEHYFDCGECAVDVKSIATFADTCREVLRQEAEAARQGVAEPERGGWFAWLRPAFAVPAMAALLLLAFVGYQNSVTIPKAKEAAARIVGQAFTTSFTLKKADTLGAEDAKTNEEEKVQVHRDESVALKFDFTPRRSFEHYTGQLQDATGRDLYDVNLPGSFTNKEVNLVVPAGMLKSGKYALVFLGTPAAKELPNQEEVLRLTFSVEILP